MTANLSAPAALVVHAATHADIPALVALENRCFNYDQIGLRSFRYFVTRSRAIVLCARLSQAPQLAGYVIALQRKNSAIWRIYSIASAPEARGKGVAKALIAHLLALAAATANITTLRLEVKCDNAPAIALYRQLGFEVIDVLPGYYSDGSDGYRLQFTFR